MVNITTILLFFVYTWGFGYTLTFFLKNSENYIERNLMRVGIGLGAFVVFGIILNSLRIPVDWRIFFVASIITPAYFVIKNRKYAEMPKKLKQITKSDFFTFVMLLLFAFTLFMYLKGSFAYPYLEDDDPWGHATSIKYISLEKTAYEPANRQFFQYIDPYPPGYDMFMAVLYQTSGELMWGMKFFNSLIISLSIIFFYFFSKSFIGNSKKALFSTFILAAIPCYLSHFIWSVSLAMALFFPAMYCLEKLNYDRKWIFPGILIIGAIPLTQPTHAIKMGILMLAYVTISFMANWKVGASKLGTFLGGYLLSGIWYLPKAKSMFLSTIEGARTVSQEAIANSTSLFGKIIKLLPNYSGTATRKYTFDDFFVAKTQNMINNPIGLGIIISILVLISIIYVFIKYKSLFKQESSWILITLSWLFITFLLVNSMTFNLPIGIFAFRAWMLLAIPIAIISSQGMWFLAGISSEIKLPKIIIFSLVIFGVLATSGYQKYAVNTAMWGPGGSWTSGDEIQGYLWLKTLPAGAKVYPLSGGSSFSHIIGMDKYVCIWCDEENEFAKTNINNTAAEIYSWMKSKKYGYLTTDGFYVQEHGINKTHEKITELLASGRFSLGYRTNGVLILNVN